MEETIRKILEMAKNAAPIIQAVTGTTLVGPAIAAGRAIIELIDGVKDTSGASQAELQASRDELETAVNAHVDNTIGRLRGDTND